MIIIISWQFLCSVRLLRQWWAWSQWVLPKERAPLSSRGLPSTEGTEQQSIKCWPQQSLTAAGALRYISASFRMNFGWSCGTCGTEPNAKRNTFEIPDPFASKSVTWWPCLSLDQSSRAKLNWTCHLPCLLSDDYHHIASFTSIRFISLSRHWCVSRSRWAVYLWTPVQPTQSYVHVCPLMFTFSFS